MIRGNDLFGHGVRERLILPGGKLVTMVFCLETFANAENIYNEVFQKDTDICGILRELSQRKQTAVMALAYAAAQVMNHDLTFESFLSELYQGRKMEYLAVLTVQLERMFYDTGGSGNWEDEPERFQWEDYYKQAKRLGLSDEEFWAATPKKIAALIVDQEALDEAKRLTELFV